MRMPWGGGSDMSKFYGAHLKEKTDLAHRKRRLVKCKKYRGKRQGGQGTAAEMGRNWEKWQAHGLIPR